MTRNKTYTHTLTKNDLVEKISHRIGFPKNKSVAVIEQLLEIMKSSLEKEADILVSGFGKFTVLKKKERRGRNPATGGTMMIEPRKVVSFKHSAGLKELMNK